MNLLSEARDLVMIVKMMYDDFRLKEVVLFLGRTLKCLLGGWWSVGLASCPDVGLSGTIGFADYLNQHAKECCEKTPFKDLINFVMWLSYLALDSISSWIVDECTKWSSICLAHQTKVESLF